jgi:hypothetical protein
MHEFVAMWEDSRQRHLIAAAPAPSPQDRGAGARALTRSSGPLTTAKSTSSSGSAPPSSSSSGDPRGFAPAAEHNSAEPAQRLVETVLLRRRQGRCGEPSSDMVEPGQPLPAFKCQWCDTPDRRA